jgi:D-alanyl-D-alanine carboxypeptidase (penicillin-binding protein 5/6)
MTSRNSVHFAATGLLVVIAGVTAASPAAATTVATRLAASAPSGIHAKGAEIANATTGAVLWTRAAATERPMGSITKVMTALLVIEGGNLNREITVPKAVLAYVRKYNGSSAGLVPGDKLTARELLYGMMLPSGCDAAYVLASAYGGKAGRSGFIAAMNRMTRKLGLGRTRFSSFDGLPWPTEYSTYSTPGDLVALGRDAMKLAVFRQVVATHRYHVAAGSGHHAYTWHNTNPLIGVYKGAIGIKTGSTAAARYCVLFEAVRGGKTLIGVVLGDSTVPLMGSDAEKMLNWGFSR